MTSIQELYKVYKNSTGVCTDTRSITKGCLFFALKGASFNGNLFATKAIEAGALAVVVDDVSVVDGEQYFFVSDVLRTLQDLANYHRNTLDIPVIGVTGTNGKTTTKELIKSVLDRKFEVLATEGNFNNHIGVPLTLLSIKDSCEVAVIEMGANHQGEIAFLCEIAEPTMGLITNVGKAHLEGFGSFEGVKKTKSELYKFIESKAGLLFVNKENNHLKGMLGEGADLFYYGADDTCEVRFVSVESSPNLAFNCFVDGKTVHVKSHLIGGYNLENALAAISIGKYLGVRVDEIVKAIEEYVPNNNRSQLITTEHNKVLFDAYNANPTSMGLAVGNFLSLEEDNKVMILGEMKELGDDSEKEHSILLDSVRKNGEAKVFLVGDQYTTIIRADDNFKWFNSVDLLKAYLQDNALLDSFILVKGSRSNKLEGLKEVL